MSCDGSGNNAGGATASRGEAAAGLAMERMIIEAKQAFLFSFFSEGSAKNASSKEELSVSLSLPRPSLTADGSVVGPYPFEEKLGGGSFGDPGRHQLHMRPTVAHACASRVTRTADAYAPPLPTPPAAPTALRAATSAASNAGE